MKLSKCNECKHQLEWKKTSKSLWFIKPQRRIIQCSNCGTQHDLCPRSRFITMFSPMTIFLFGIVINNLLLNDSVPLNIQILITVSYMLPLSILISLIFPYLLNYEKINTDYLN